MQKLGSRKAVLEDMTTDDKGIVYFEFIIPTSALFGYRSEFITDTRGLGIINTNFDRFDIDNGDPIKRERGSLVASENAGDDVVDIGFEGRFEAVLPALEGGEDGDVVGGEGVFAGAEGVAELT